MKTKILKTSLIASCAFILTLTGYAKEQDNQNPKVIIGKCFSTKGEKIKIKGQDGNIYLLDKNSIESSIVIQKDDTDTNVQTAKGFKDIKEGTTVVINIKGVVFVDIKETKTK